MNRRPGLKQKQSERLLSDWDDSIDIALLQKLERLLERRAFLTGTFRAGAVLASLPLWSSLSACDRRDRQQALRHHEPWRSFAAVQQQLLPDDGDGPSAQDLNATVYLKFVLDAPDTDVDDKKFLLDGINWLNSLTGQQKSGRVFVALTEQQQAAALQQIAKSKAGERWLSHLILYLMEALLTDPVYGGNPDGIGWQWLEHQPGFPRPPRDKRYPELL